MIKCLLTELGRAGRENIWPSVIVHGPRCARSVRHDLGPKIFPSGPPTQSISTYTFLFETDESYFKDDIKISLPDNVVPGSVNAIISTVGK